MEQTELHIESARRRLRRSRADQIDALQAAIATALDDKNGTNRKAVETLKRRLREE